MEFEAPMFDEMFQTSTVKCKDFETPGSASAQIRVRRCVDGTEASCDWEDLGEDATDGTCTFAPF